MIVQLASKLAAAGTAGAVGYGMQQLNQGQPPKPGAPYVYLIHSIVHQGRFTD
jgi:hypothetical protein